MPIYCIILLIKRKLVMEDQIALINSVLASDKYYAQGKLNEGSYGQIFQVRDKKTKQVFAIKVMQIAKLQAMKKTHQASFEILILKKIDHPGVIKMFEVVQTPKYIGLVLELCPFGDIFKLMKTINKKFELAFKKRKIMVYYLSQILETIDYLHSNQIIHRDLKPENIVLSKDLKVKLIDFGTSKVLGTGLVNSEQLEQMTRLRELSQQFSPQKLGRKSLVGTANYLSPESIELNYTYKSDIWAFGILSYKFYYNKLPFQGKDSLQIFKMIKLEQLPLDGDIDPEFQELFRLTLCKDPDQRPSAAQLKKCKIFQNINFKQIFETPPPLSKEQLQIARQQPEPQKQRQFLFQKSLQKKMFFGNFKPRCLTISKVGDRLMMAYRYIPSKKIKNEFELLLNDYATVAKGGQFQVVTTDKRYKFRVAKQESTEATVEQINKVIRKGYALQ